MFSKIFLSKSKLISNVNYLKRTAGKPICVMVKANAYGHGEKEIVKMLDGVVPFFGVSNQKEGIDAKKLTTGSVVVFGKCENYLKCMKNDVSFALFSFEDAKSIVSLAKKNNLFPRFHLCLNSGMNRYGFKYKEDIERTIDFLDKESIPLEGFYTHFSSLTSDKNYTEKQKNKFYEFSSLLPKEWKTIRHVGGGNTIYKNIDADMYRVGLQCYGYGDENVSPVLKVESHIVDVQNVKEGEHIGYLCGYTATKDMKIATIPLGYGDGFPRKLSNKLEVVINGQKARSTGNICMDAFMVDVSELDCQKGNRVLVLDNATTLAPLIDSTEYEVLTNLTKLRGQRVIVD